MTKPKILKIVFFSLLFILIVISSSSIIIFQFNSSYLFERGPININSNSEFTNANGVTSGNGTEEAPYVIEGWKIITLEDLGISISNTSAFFIICNCYIDAGNEGIKCESIVPGTAKILNNTCINNYYGISLIDAVSSVLINNTILNGMFDGIVLQNSSHSFLADNTCINNFNGINIRNSYNCTVKENKILENRDDGIYFFHSDECSCTNNVCSNNTGAGIFFFSSKNAEILNNTCTHQTVGIYLTDSSNSYLSFNQCRDNYDGITLFSSNYSYQTNNTCFQNKDAGLEMYSSSYSIIHTCENYNNKKGIYLSNFCTQNVFYHNLLINNSIIDAEDNGENNQWYNETTKQGNYWGNYYGKGEHIIEGTADSRDLYPFFTDSDLDGLADFQERFYGTAINNPDTDNDKLSDFEEIVIYKTNPVQADTDQDGWVDSKEVKRGTDPLDPLDYPKNLLIIFGFSLGGVIFIGLAMFFFRQKIVQKSN